TTPSGGYYNSPPQDSSPPSDPLTPATPSTPTTPSGATGILTHKSSGDYLAGGEP
ncbi:hypothetical protein A2U01_0042550, partial [Trifolium medium]|nr:hypothetical protein [Trifolium medium]